MCNKKLNFICSNQRSGLYWLYTDMKNLLLLLLFSCCAALTAQNKEFRATWVVTSQYISPSSTVEENKARIIRILEEHKKAHMTAVLWQVRQSGSAYYQSSYEPWGSYAGGSYPGFDPLAFVIQEAHKRGLEVHAWFNTFMISSNAPGRVTALHPDWVCTNGDGASMTKYYALSPGIEQVRKYTLDVAMEIVNNYDIDGLHLDYIRWNEYDNADMLSKKSEEFPLDGMISEEKLLRLKSTEPVDRFIFDSQHPYNGGIPAGYTNWGDWRRDCVTEFVKSVHDSIQKVKPYVRLSVAAIGKYKDGGDNGWNGYYVVFQDAAKWFNLGYIDQLTPMHYSWYTAPAFINAIDADWYPDITEGIAAKRLYTAGPGSYILEEYNAWNNHGPIVDSCRNRHWIDGFQFFSYQSWSDRNYWAEAGSSFFKRQTHVREMRTGYIPSSPVINLSRTDSLNYVVTVTPADAGNQWYAIYRSEDNVFDPDSDDIIFITFGSQPFTVTDSFDGLQNFNGRYTYFSTAFSRYWNESVPSGGVQTDPIPSFSPHVTYTNPPGNGRIPVNGSITAAFSKEMNPQTINDAFTIQPAAAFTFSWADDKKSVTVNFGSGLRYQTKYRIVLSPSLADVNGTALDGNGDGVPGDEYVLDFATFPKDSLGPVMVQSTIKDDDADVDLASVFSFTYNEKLDPVSVSQASISLKRSDGTDVPLKSVTYCTPKKEGVISVQPVNLLDVRSKYHFDISGDIRDTLGNKAGNDTLISFTTSGYRYLNIQAIDDFSTLTGWQKPSYSGSTTGVILSGLSFGTTSGYGLPVTLPASSACLSYAWDTSLSPNLIREYLSPSSAQAGVQFDTTLVLQVFLFGDSSNTKFRFCLDEYGGTDWTDHEVSKWTTINWNGWKLVEWDLSNKAETGSWISPDNLLNRSKYRTDSFQFTIDDNRKSVQGNLYLDNYRVVKKIFVPAGPEKPADGNDILLETFPNPFATSVTVNIIIKEQDVYRLTVYDLAGHVIERRSDSHLSEGENTVHFGDGYKPGVYILEVKSASSVRRIKIVKL